MVLVVREDGGRGEVEVSEGAGFGGAGGFFRRLSGSRSFCRAAGGGRFGAGWGESCGDRAFSCSVPGASGGRWWGHCYFEWSWLLVRRHCIAGGPYYSATETGDTKRHIGLGGVERKSGFSWDAF